MKVLRFYHRHRQLYATLISWMNAATSTLTRDASVPLNLVVRGGLRKWTDESFLRSPPLPCLSRHPLPTHDWRFRVGLGCGCLFHTQLPGLSQILTSLTPWTGLSYKLSFFVYNTFFPLRGRCVWTLLGQYHSNYLHTSSRELVFRSSHAPLEWVCSHVSSALRRVLNSKNCWNDLKRPLCDN